MTDTTKAQILDLARKAINTEMLALKHMKETLGDNFADAVELILACSGKCIVTGMGKSGLVARSPRRWPRPEPRVSSCIPARPSTAIWG